ncbi:glucose dehydrogenase [Caerostris darwini]|uniref:Glucose dehydrogenase n=1 Tax=Caerostris darwini TaxID=1538125 RepID=A0AAV4X5N8_9ARAC|nr:glucose dehydrogenase [Caerostris darwini]
MRNGQRCSAAKGYLVPAENRTNLDLIGGAHVRKVVFKGKRAIGVKFDYKDRTFVVRARKEVIMSAGTTNSAQLLMLSGVGPKEHLEKFKIPVVADLPVGDNFQDHCAPILPFSLDPSIPTVTEKQMNPENIKQYINTKTGVVRPLSSSEYISSMAFLRYQHIYPDVDFPDYELYFAEVPKEVPRDQIGIIPAIYQLLFGPYENGPMFICLAQVLHPRSRGTVRLQSTNPYDPPLIDPNYFHDPRDLQDVVEGLKSCFRLGTSVPMLQAGVRPFATLLPACGIFLFNVDKYFACLAQAIVVTLSHQVGTAKMGDPKDPTTVVDPQLRVKGIKGLRVVDASVMPIIPSGNTNIPTIMVAEKASDIIKETIHCPHHHDEHHHDEYHNFDFDSKYKDDIPQHYSVKGIKGLRVVDASVMPIIPSGNTNIPTIMVAEKASDIIKETIHCPHHHDEHHHDEYHNFDFDSKYKDDIPQHYSSNFSSHYFYDHEIPPID